MDRWTTEYLALVNELEAARSTADREREKALALIQLWRSGTRDFPTLYEQRLWRNAGAAVVMAEVRLSRFLHEQASKRD